MAPDPKESSSDTDTTSSRSSSPESTTEAKPTVKESSKQHSKSSESSSSESDENASSSSDEESSNDRDTSSIEDTKATKQQSIGPNIPSRPTKAFKPPSGFKAVRKQSAPSSEASSILSNASGKQVFHITAPAFLPLSKVKEVSMGKIMQGEPILNHEGVNYGIPPGNINQGDWSEKKLLLYDPKSQDYCTSRVPNVQSYHIQEMVRLPQTQTTSSTSGPQQTAKPAKKQPKNLKMRFRPVGSGDGPAEMLGSSSESEGERPTPKAKGSSKEKEERKRKHHHTEGDGNPGGVRKKSKKHSSPDGENVPPSQMEVDEPGHKRSKKSSKNRDEKKRKKSQETA